MKIWIANNKSVIRDEKSLLSFLIKEKAKGNTSVQIEVMEAVQESKTTVGELFSSIVEDNIKKGKEASSPDEEEFVRKTERFEELYVKYMGSGSEFSLFLANFKATEKKRKSIAALCKKSKDHLLCEVSREVDWYEALIDVSGIDEMVDRYYQKINGYNTRVLVSDKTKKTFLKAKKNLKK
jgi:hypothetical protein